MRFLITFVMILSIIAFIHLSKTYPQKDVRTQPNNISLNQKDLKLKNLFQKDISNIIKVVNS